MIKYTTN